MTTVQLHPPRVRRLQPSSRSGGLTSRGRRHALPFAFASAYLVVAYLGRLTVPDGSTLSLVWPAAGLGALWFLWTPTSARLLNSLLLVACVVLTAFLTGGDGWLLVFGTAAHLVMTHVTAELIRPWWSDRTGGARPRLDRPVVLARVFGASLAGTLGSAVIATAGHVLFASGSGVDLGFFGLLLGRNLCGTVIVLAVALTWPTRAELERPLGLRTVGELIVVTAVTGATYVAVFLNGTLPVAFTLLVGTVWVGVRFTPWASSMHSLVVGTATIAATMLDGGPFAVTADVEGRSLIAQAFVLTVSITGLALATERAQAQRYQRRLEVAETNATQQAAFLQGVMSSITEGIVVLDRRGAVRYRNQAAIDLAEADPVHADGVPGLDTDRGLSALSDAREGRTTSGLEVTQRREVGDRVLTVTTMPLDGSASTTPTDPDDPDDPAGAAVVVVADSTSAYAQRTQLAAFAGTVAHDLRNPLASIDGWAEILAEAVEAAADADAPLETDLVRRAVDRVQVSSNQMQELITDLLVHATAGDRELHAVAFALADVVAEVATEQQVAVRADATLGQVVAADRSMVKQLLHNLVGNAHKYVAPGVTPDVSIHAELSHGRVEVHVDDNGIGIPEGEREKVFDEFHRAHPQGYAGSGLGLAICRRIVQRHGGEIVAEPRPGGGTTITFSLPTAA